MVCGLAICQFGFQKTVRAEPGAGTVVFTGMSVL